MRVGSAIMLMVVMTIVLCGMIQTTSAETILTKGHFFNMIWQKAFESQHVAQVDVPFSSCGKPTDHMNISSVTANAWPPVKGDDLILNVSGIVDEKVTSGTYVLEVSYYGITIINQNGDLTTFLELPAGPGLINISYSEDLPSSSPAGPYVVTISANDQNNEEILCMVVKFTLDLEEVEVIFVPVPTKFADDTDEDAADSDEVKPVQSEVADIDEKADDDDDDDDDVQADDDGSKPRVVRSWGFAQDA